MSKDYTPEAQGALDSVREAGRQAVIRRLSRTVTPATGAVTAVTVTSGGLLDTLVLPVNRGMPMDERMREAFVKGKLRKLLAAAASAPFLPEYMDVVLFGGQYWLVLGCTELKISSPSILYSIIVENTNLSTADIAALALTAEETVVAAS